VIKVRLLHGFWASAPKLEVHCEDAVRERVGDSRVPIREHELHVCWRRWVYSLIRTEVQSQKFEQNLETLDIHNRTLVSEGHIKNIIPMDSLHIF